MHIWKKLKDIRTSRNLSQDELATLLDTSKQVISRYERGERIPKISQAAEWAKKLNLPLSAFVDTEFQKENNLPAITFDDKQVMTIIELLTALPDRKKQEAIRYIRYLADSPDT